MTDDVLLKRPTLRKRVGFRRMFDEGVALVAETSKVNVLNESGSRFLELADGTRTTGQILELLVDEYASSPEEIRRDVLAFVEKAAEAGLIELREGPREP